MKILSLKIDSEKLKLTKEDKERPMAEIVTQVIENIILTYAQQARGFDEKERKQYYRISEAFDKAKAEKKDSVDLDDEYIGFIRKCFRESKLMPNELLKQIEEVLDSINR